MKLYSLNSRIDFGEYDGEMLKEVFMKEPGFIEMAIMEYPDFVFPEVLIEKLEEMHGDFVFSDAAVEKLQEKYEAYEDKENEFDDFEDFSEDDLKNMGIMDDSFSDDYDDSGDSGGYYDDGYGY